MENIEQILKESKINKWPYPKTFEALKAASVKSYSVYIAGEYRAVYLGVFGNWSELTLPDYKPLQIAKQFSKNGVKAAIIKHIHEKNSFVEFLEDIASNGSSHYKVDMDARTVTYFNDDESDFHQENVPLWAS